MKALIIAALILFVPSLCLAQGVQEQAKVATHATVSLNSHVSLAGWVIEFPKNDAPDSLNLIGGVGLKGKSWSLENMLWRQLSAAGNQWGLDFRFNRPLKNGFLYMEVAPYLTKQAVYHDITVERRVIGRLSLGGEMENTYQAGKDSLGGGPRMSFLLAKTAHYRLVTSYGYQWRRRAPDWSRLYLILHVTR